MTILLKIRTVHLFTQKKKQYADLYKEDQAAYPQKKRKKTKKKKNPKTQTVVPDQDSYSF